MTSSKRVGCYDWQIGGLGTPKETLNKAGVRDGLTGEA
jgi:hypothetical protein